MDTLLADLLQKLHEERRTGALVVTIHQSKDYPMRFWFESGEIRRLAYGPLRGKECMDLLYCYDFGNAIFVDGMKTPFDADVEIPKTPGFISEMRKTGKKIESFQVASKVGRDLYLPAAA